MSERGRLLIKGGTVISVVDGESPRRADVLVEDGVITSIAPDLEVDAERIDASSSLVLPGLVDTHRHTWQTALRGVTHEWTLKDYIRGIRLQSAKYYRPEDIYIGNRLGMLEAINAGVTSVLDFSHCINSPDHAAEALRGTRDAGIRSVFALGFNSVPVDEPYFTSLDQRLDHASRFFAEEFADGNDGRVRFGIALSDMEVGGLETIIRQAQFAKDLGVPVTLHADAVLSESFVSIVEQLSKHDLIWPGVVWVHMNFASLEQTREVIQKGGAVSVTPETEMQMGMGHPSFGKVLAAGGRPSLGVDVVCNNSGDILTQLRLALQTQRMLDHQDDISRSHGPDTVELKTPTALRAGTLSGAEALGLGDKTGSLQVGKAADIITVRTDAINTMPSYDPVGTFVLQSHPGNIDTVLVDGEILKRDGKLVQDIAPLRAQLEKSAAYLFEHIERNGGLIPQPPIPLW
ncbi:amidohydrolase family protein [Nocardia sp. R7R-8]|uniref:amidohydrolase family protein n=1 Tax=Nocardia sp. R7R-8 TaxID=3459304 RepID=UPI00403E092E